MKHTRSAILGAVLLVAGLSACAEDAPVGEMGLSLVSTGSDGSIYRLPEDSYLILEAAGFYDQLPLGGDAETISVALPPGDYEATLAHPAGYALEWPLTRELSGGTSEVVIAALISPQPQSFAVVEGGTTGLVLRFQVPEAGTVTFGQGNVDVTVVVDETGAEGLSVSWSTVVTVDEVTTYPAFPAALTEEMPISGQTVTVAITADVTGDWTQTGISTVCTPARYSLTDASGQRLLRAVAGGSFRELTDLCVTTRDGTSYLSATFVNVTAPTEAPFDDPAVGADQMLFLTALEADLGEVVFDGGTLDLAAMVGAHLPQTTAVFIADGFDGGRQRWLRVNGSSVASLTIAATATAPDLDAPVLTLLSTPATPTNSSTATFEFAASEPVDARCAIDGGAPIACTSPWSITGLADGVHTVTIDADDQAGNAAQQVQFDWTIDTVAPALVLVEAPPVTTTDTNAQFTVSFDEPVTLQCRLDGGPWQACAATVSYAVAVGSHSFQARATDLAGNASTVSHSWTVAAP